MALIRCQQCNTPLTEEEMATGACPLCAAAVERPATPAVVPTPPKPTVTGPSATQTMLFLVGGAFVFCLLPFSIIFYATLRDTPKKDPGVVKEPPPKLAQAVPKKKEPEPEKKVVEEPEEKSLATEPKVEEKKIEPKKEEPKKTEEIKKVEIAKVEPKKVEPKAEPVKLANAYLPFVADDAITIDGGLDDWKDVRPQFLVAVQRGKTTKKVVAAPKTQKAYLAHGPRGILVAVDVVDTSGELENVPRNGKGPSSWAFWDNDAVEVYIDTLNRRPRHRGEPSAHQFIAFPFGANDPGIGGYESRILGSNWSVLPMPNVGKNAMLSAGKKTATGWTLEMLIPRSALRHSDVVKPGHIVGFEIQIDTGTNVFYHWANDNPDVRVSTNPSTWAEIALAGTDAKIEILGKEGEPVQTLLPGEPLRIRVHDADVNLDPVLRERMSVTVQTRSGARRTLELKETKINSGVFFFMLATRLKNGPEPDAFPVEPGDLITIEYVDRVRANGTRNTPVRADVVVNRR